MRKKNIFFKFFKTIILFIPTILIFLTSIESVYSYGGAVSYIDSYDEYDGQYLPIESTTYEGNDGTYEIYSPYFNFGSMSDMYSNFTDPFIFIEKIFVNIPLKVSYKDIFGSNRTVFLNYSNNNFYYGYVDTHTIEILDINSRKFISVYSSELTVSNNEASLSSFFNSYQNHLNTFSTSIINLTSFSFNIPTSLNYINVQLIHIILVELLFMILDLLLFLPRFISSKLERA